MRRSEEEGEIDDQLKHLQYDCSCSKKWSIQSPHCKSDGAEIISVMDSSTRELISSLQKLPSSSSGWKVRTNDLAINELIKERQAAIKSGILKGRRLFDASDDDDELGLQEERCSACSYMIHGSEVRSLCSYSSCDNYAGETENGDDYEHGGGVCVGNMEREIVAGVKGKGANAVGIIDRMWWVGRIAWIAFGVVVFALFISPWKSFHGRQHCERLIPT